MAGAARRAYAAHVLRRTLAPALLLSVLALTACGGSDDAGPTTIDGTGYRTTTPSGWTDARKLAAKATFDVDRFYAKVVDKQIRDNVIITRETVPASVGDQPIERLEPEVRAGSAKTVGVPTPPAEAPTTLDGEPARTWTFRREQDGKRIVQRQLIALHRGVLYTVTLSSLASADKGDGLLRTVAEGWDWD